MVHQPSQSGAVEGAKRGHGKVAHAIFDIFVMLVTAVATYTIFKLTTVKPENQEVNNPDVITKTLTDDSDNSTTEWAKGTILQWLADYPQDFRVGVVLYDFDEDSIVGEVAADDVFIEQTSSNLADRFNVSFIDEGQTTARKALEIVRAAYRHAEMSEEDYTNLKNELLIQKDFYSEDLCRGDCRIRNGVPAGFQTATVYNENYMHLGDSGYIAYRDISMIEFKTDDEQVKTFALVLLAERFSDQADFAKLGNALETVIAEHLNEKQSD